MEILQLEFGKQYTHNFYRKTMKFGFLHSDQSN